MNAINSAPRSTDESGSANDRAHFEQVGGTQTEHEDITQFGQDAEQSQGTAHRAALAGMVIQLFDHWQLDLPDQAAVLGLDASDPTAMDGFRKGEPGSANSDLDARVGQLLGIHQSLRRLFPRNLDLAYAWMKTRNGAFSGRAPAELATEDGLSGLMAVRSYLARAVDS